MASQDMNLFKMVQDMSNHVLDLVKQTGELGGDIKSNAKEIVLVSNKQEELSGDLKELKSIVSSRMTPDRCVYVHEELKRDTKKEILSDLRKGAKGWVRTTITILKFAALISIIFGGGSLAAKMLGVLR